MVRKKKELKMQMGQCWKAQLDLFFLFSSLRQNKFERNFLWRNIGYWVQFDWFFLFSFCSDWMSAVLFFYYVESHCVDGIISQFSWHKFRALMGFWAFIPWFEVNLQYSTNYFHKVFELNYFFFILNCEQFLTTFHFFVTLKNFFKNEHNLVFSCFYFHIFHDFSYIYHNFQWILFKLWYTSSLIIIHWGFWSHF